MIQISVSRKNLHMIQNEAIFITLKNISENIFSYKLKIIYSLIEFYEIYIENANKDKILNCKNESAN